MWDLLKFKDSPYNPKPLRPVGSDVELLIGRASEGMRLCTCLDSEHDGVVVVSGQPGVGKTSFINIYQYLLERKKAPFGPRVLAARELCPIRTEDKSRDIALRALNSLCRSVERGCSELALDVPPETKKVTKWLNNTKASGYNIGINVAGFGGSFGRSVHLSNPSDISYEGLNDAITAVVGEVVTSLNFDRSIIVLDNIENLPDAQIANIMMNFRDTLFNVPGLWWIIIGQEGLGSLLRTLDQRVADRVSAVVQLEPISLQEFHSAIHKRVEAFHESGKGQAPLSEAIHTRLYQASDGEIRYVFQKSNQICVDFVSNVRSEVAEDLKGAGEEMFEELDKAFLEVMGQYLTKNQIEDKIAMSILKNMIAEEIRGLNLSQREKDVLRKIGQIGSARAKDYKEFNRKTMQDFSSNYLVKLHGMNLLTKRQEGRAVSYSLRGSAALAKEFKLL